MLPTPLSLCLADRNLRKEMNPMLQIKPEVFNNKNAHLDQNVLAFVL